MNRLQSIAAFRSWQATLKAAWMTPHPACAVCDGTGCRALGSQKVLGRLKEELAKRMRVRRSRWLEQAARVLASAGR